MKESSKCILVLFATLAYLLPFNRSGLACDIQYFIKNNSNMAILEFYLIDADTKSPSDGLELLAGAGGAMNPRDSRAIIFKANGDFNAVFKMSDGEYYNMPISDICENNTITIFNSGFDIRISVQ